MKNVMNDEKFPYRVFPLTRSSVESDRQPPHPTEHKYENLPSIILPITGPVEYPGEFDDLECQTQS